MNEIKIELIQKAVLEAIYFWQSYEYEYVIGMHKAFKCDDSMGYYESSYKKTFHQFLTKFKIRRCIKAGGDAEREFFSSLVGEEGLFRKIYTEFDILSVAHYIDEHVAKIYEYEFTNNKKILSAVTKASFLLRPQDLPLYDKFVKKSVEEIVLSRSRKIYSYEDYLENFESFRHIYSSTIKKTISDFDFYTSLKEFKGTAIWRVNIEELLLTRTLDKLLWLFYKYRLDENK